jgi:acetyltransferase
MTGRDDNSVTVRRMRVADAAMHDEFIASLGPDDLRFRFGSRIDAVPDAGLHDVARVDHDRHVTFVATAQARDGRCAIVGEARLHGPANDGRAEFAIAVHPDFQRRGLGRAMLEQLVAFCRARSVGLLYGLVDPTNAGMLALARKLGFEIDRPPDAAPVIVSIEP